MTTILLKASGYRRMRWKNDGGWTTEIARDPADATDFRWRISIAEIERDGPFSPFIGVERELMLLSGNGIELDIGGAPTLRLVERFRHVRFAGEAHVDCRLIAGPTRDFNVMTRRDAVRAELIARPLVGPMVLFPETSVVWLAHLFSGSAEAQTDSAKIPLETGDTLRIDFDGRDAGRVVIDGGGEIVLVKLVPASRA
ncbi:MAG TPA: HutD family protein [Rhodanobacteraceae bacterium]|nr:HutD family protein [Rhodanobacteraceae bacterium]